MNDFSQFTHLDMTRVDAEARQMRAQAMRDALKAFGTWIGNGARAVVAFIARPSHV
ncbi:hypothetical protein FHS89_001282 [Rubricella aquisinus]|jgi:hypothetical protein|uniref:Uncharacterized protein n=1 Tax=Rubricella aquisinus TaxID=2028108 RepID=A0A840WNP1_9RHOB|nr:hypothetical protein [Rubricella aquisinus]MBB5515272.1 hypothetical protein [Rubricella aquisinus]